MGRKKQLNEFERGQFTVLREMRLNWSEIGRRIGRKGETCKSFFEDQENYGKKHIKGRKSKTSDATKRLICRIASNNMMSSAKIVEELKLQVTPRTMRNVLNDSKYFKYRKLKKKPPLTLLNQKRRLAWAMRQVSFREK